MPVVHRLEVGLVRMIGCGSVLMYGVAKAWI